MTPERVRELFAEGGYSVGEYCAGLISDAAELEKAEAVKAERERIAGLIGDYRSEGCLWQNCQYHCSCPDEVAGKIRKL